MTDWQSIDTAPKDGTLLLLYDRYERHKPAEQYVGRWVDETTFEEPYRKTGYGKWVTGTGAFNKRPTHWMPLPEPPER